MSVGGSEDDGASGPWGCPRFFAFAIRRVRNRFRRHNHIERGVPVSKTYSVSLIAAFAAITLAAPLAAQTRSSIDVGTLDAAVATRRVDNRAAVTAALTSGSALTVAASMGLSPDAVANRIAALDDASAKKVADQILAGGDQTIVISTTAIIIGLLLIILLTR
jgi:hypothetical protein